MSNDTNTNTIDKVTGPVENKLTVKDITINPDILDTINKQFSNVQRYRTATYNSWVKIGNAFTSLKKACNGDTKLFGMVIKKAEHDKTLPVIGKDNRSSSMTLVDWINNGFDDVIIDNELSFTDWKSKYASRKSSPDTLIKAVNKAAKMAIKVKNISDAKAKTPALDTPEVDTPEVDTPEVDTPEVNTPEVDTVTPERVAPSIADLSTFDNSQLAELFGLIQAEIIGRYQSDRMNDTDMVDIVKINNALKDIINPVQVAMTGKAKWTNTI